MSIFNKSYKTDKELIEEQKEAGRRKKQYKRKISSLYAQSMFEKLVDLYNLSRKNGEECAFTKLKIIKSSINKRTVTDLDVLKFTDDFYKAKRKFQTWLGKDEVCIFCRSGGGNFYWVITPDINSRYLSAKEFAVTTLQVDRSSRAFGIKLQAQILDGSKLGQFNDPQELKKLRSSTNVREQLLEIKERAEQFVV